VWGGVSVGKGKQGIAQQLQAPTSPLLPVSHLTLAFIVIHKHRKEEEEQEEKRCFDCHAWR